MEERVISEYIEDFLFSKEIEEGCSKSTIREYGYDLEMLVNIVGDLNLNSPLLRQKIRKFLKILSEKGYTKKGIARKIASIRSFFTFLSINDFITKDPMLTIKTPKITLEENLPKFLNLDEMEMLLDYLKNNSLFNSKRSERYQVIIRLLYATMARVSEICRIRIKDVDFKKGYITLRGKGNKQRIVPVDDETLILLERAIKNRIYHEADDFLLTNTRNGPLTVRLVQMDIKKIKRKCGFLKSKKVTPHVFRHTGATHLRRAGMDISELQDLLGHSSVNTTKIYAKNDISSLKQNYNKLHPLNTLNEK